MQSHVEFGNVKFHDKVLSQSPWRPRDTEELGIWNCGEEMGVGVGHNKNNTNVFKQLSREEIVHAREWLQNVLSYVFESQL